MNQEELNKAIEETFNKLYSITDPALYNIDACLQIKLAAMEATGRIVSGILFDEDDEEPNCPQESHPSISYLEDSGIDMDIPEEVQEEFNVAAAGLTDLMTLGSVGGDDEDDEDDVLIVDDSMDDC